MTHKILQNPSRVLLFSVVFLLTSCASTKEYPPGSIKVEGEMRQANVEGGCWVFKAKNGQTYELIGPDVKQLQKEGRRVEVVINPRTDLIGFCMVGKIVELIDIIKIYPELYQD